MQASSIRNKAGQGERCDVGIIRAGGQLSESRRPSFNSDKRKKTKRNGGRHRPGREEDATCEDADQDIDDINILPGTYYV